MRNANEMGIKATDL